MRFDHRARRLAIQGLCCLDVQGDRAMELVGEFIDDSRLPPAVLRAARRMLEHAWADRAACDELLARHARHWDVDRLALVDRNILRLATHELRFAKAPPSVVITEAIRLAREFSTSESPRFVNGILDAVARAVRRDGGNGAEGSGGR
ncbi:MAG: transcription antitermination factor NusB [Planctomycetes bacterium]|nr:transcription antitermination factor NusB [Planctomycetota bacterium]